jgi:N12 class adenine-specific DNA methylase
MYESILQRVTSTPAEWTAFLRSACRNYKLPFNDQILIYAQRPDAVAVLEIEKWNRQFGRWVNKGARGIAVFDDEHNEGSRLKHYFDISDTHESRFSRPVPIWEMCLEYEADVTESLENSFGEQKDASDFAAVLISTARSATDDNIPDYLSELMDCREDSYLEGLDERDVETRYRSAIGSSVAYMLLVRCGLDADKYVDIADFRHLSDFNTRQTANAIGSATSDIAESCLREIAMTVQNLQSREQTQNRTFAPKTSQTDNKEVPSTERSTAHGRADISDGRRLSTAQSDIAGGTTRSPWQVRIAKEAVSEAKQTDSVHEPLDGGDAERTPDGNRADSKRADGTADRADGTGAGRRRADESRRPDEMGGPYEQHPSLSGGSDTDGPDIRIKPLPTEHEQLTLFGEAEDEKSSAFSISQQIIDEVLTSGGNGENSVCRIVSYFKKDHLAADNAAFLKGEYGTGGKGFIFGGSHVSVWFDERGIRIAEGDSAQSSPAASLVTWEQAARRVRELLDMGRFAPQSELDKADGVEIKALAERLQYLERELADGCEFSFMEADLLKGGFPESTARIAEFLAQPKQRKNVLDGLYGFAEAYEENTDLLRFGYSVRHLREALTTLEDLQREPLTFTADESVPAPRPGFITQDEVDKVLTRGGNVEHGKFRIYSYFLHEHTAKEKADFLKHEYGTGGGGRTGFNEWHDSKGITYSRENNHMPYDKVILPWAKVAKRIDELIADGRYMTERELAYLPEYEMSELAREVYSFFYNRPEDVPRPYPHDADFHEAVKVVRPQLDEPERVAEILGQMAATLEGTAGFDRHYESMQKAFADLTAYQNGEYTLFPKDRPAEKQQVAEKTAQPKAAPTPPESSGAGEADKYDLALGVTVWLGLDEHEISSFDDNKVVLRDVNAPLFTRELPRDEFDRKLRENSLNDHLVKTADETAPTPQIGKEAEPPRIPKMGDRYEIDGRLFEVDGVDADAETVSLRDVTFEGAAGFPIFRSESFDFIRRYEPIAKRPQDLPAEKEQAASDEPITPAWEKPKPKSRVNVFDPHPEIPQSKRQNYRIADDDLGAGGAKAKYKGNVEAIRTLQTVESGNRFATPEEQEILSHYVGWGALQHAFDPENGQWANEYAELKALLTSEEWESARSTTLNAHYTSPAVIKAIYKAVENTGFRTGNVLEPSCGIGNFFGLVPESMSGSKMFGVEIDNLTGRIARQLYQKNSIAIQGFEKTELPDSFFDLAIGNVPFGSYGVVDKRYDKHKFHIHDYFFARTLDKVRPGGIIAFITSRFTLDKKDSSVRKYIAQRADLLGAIRLPMTAFKANAGTEVTTDIIFLQKRDRIVDTLPDWVHLGYVDGTGADGEEAEIAVNSYFAEHPDMILGTMSQESGTRMYGNENSVSCVPFEGGDLAEQLAEAITNIHAEVTEYEMGEDEPEEDGAIPADPNVRNYSYTTVDGQIYYRQDSIMVPVTIPVTAQNRVRSLIELRECVRTLIFYQTNDYPGHAIDAEQARLNRLYDGFIRKYGLINSRGNSMAFSQDSAYCLLCSLEIIDENGDARKADMFTKRTIRPHTPITHMDTATEALAVSLSEKARVDLSYMSQLTGMSEESLTEELKGVVFLNIGSAGSQDKTYVTSDEYLSGNIREKLVSAKAAQKALPDGGYDVNVKALEAAMPPDLTAAEISVRLGATWLPEETVQQFMYELLGTPPYARERVRVHYSHHTGGWNVTEKTYDRTNIQSTGTYGTRRVNAYQIIEQSLNLRDVRVFDKVYTPEGDEKRVLNKKETAIAQAKQEIIKAKFEEWIWKDPTRREALCRLYNDKFNSIRPRVYDGSHLTFPGMNPEITLRKHQIDAIAHILYGGNTLLAHEVGAGKTFAMAAAAMEMKRLGIANKNLIVVPNHITEQWAAEWLQLYPSANILVATKKDFEKRNRKKFCARIATGDWDAVIIGHSQFEKIPISAERQQEMLRQQISGLLAGIDELKQNRGEKFTIKQMEKMRKSLEVRLEKLNDQSRKDDIVTFEELGVDRLFVDEAHYFKNLYLITKMRNVGGIAQTEAQKSSDLFLKTRYLDEMTGGRGTVFATGTPISNSMVELYTMQRYLQYAELEKSGLVHFDAWASTFGETVTAIELAPEGSGYRAKTRFAKFYNLPELMSMFRTVADIQTADMLNLPVPQANFHNIVLKPSNWQKEMVSELAERAEVIRRGDIDPTADNMLKVTNDGRKLALDQRLINPMLPDEADGKVAACAKDVFRIWGESKEERSAQLVFCDLSTPKADGSFNVYDDLKQKLTAKGVPEDEIAFIHDANTEMKKKELFARVRKGQVRVLMGSTQKMGAGTNVQDRLIALHDCDCPWRPSDLAQRLGRIVRQGNRNPEVEVFRYVTEGTFDSYLYQLVENKQRFIAQIMTGKTPVRTCEDVDETALSYAEIKALATGNPLIIEKCQLEMDVNKLKILQASHNSQKYALEDKILKEYPQEIKRLTERIEGYKADGKTAANHPADKDHFPPMRIGGNLFAEKKDAGNAIIKACKAMTSPDPVALGEYRGFPMILSYDSYGAEYKVTLSGALSHTVSLGTDIHGNITRLDNALERIAFALAQCESELAHTREQMEAAQSEVSRPFPQESEYAEKSKRLKEVNALLNMGEKDSAVLDAAPDEGDMEPTPKAQAMER